MCILSIVALRISMLAAELFSAKLSSPWWIAFMILPSTFSFGTGARACFKLCWQALSKCLCYLKPSFGWSVSLPFEEGVHFYLPFLIWA